MKQLAKPPLAATHVHDAIDEGIAELVAKWHKLKLPKKMCKAFKIWKKYRPRPLRLDRLQKRQRGVGHLNQRIAEVREESMSVSKPQINPSGVLRFWVTEGGFENPSPHFTLIISPL